jgi:hypothetical protein
MKKILIPFIILLALYIGYNKFTSDVEPTEQITENSAEEPIKDVYVKYVKEPEVEDIDDNPLLGEYSASVKNGNITADIKFELMPNQKISHYRYVDRDGVISEGIVEGEYVIVGDTLEFTFPEARDKNVFKMGMLILKVDRDNNISSGTVNFVKL